MKMEEKMTKREISHDLILLVTAAALFFFFYFMPT